MWRGSRAFWFTVACAGGLALLVLAGHSGSIEGPNASSSAAACPVNYHPTNLSVAGCSVPSGGTLDPCSLATLGVIHCPFGLPDFNPADWLSWFGCVIVADSTAIFNAIVGQLSTWLGQLLSTLLSGATSFVNQVLGVFESAFTGVFNTLSSAFGSLGAGISNVAQFAGPFAPEVAIVLAMGLLILGTVALYFGLIAGIALGKSLYNIL